MRAKRFDMKFIYLKLTTFLKIKQVFGTESLVYQKHRIFDKTRD